MAAYRTGDVVRGPKQAYVIEGELGSGGFAATYLARREGDGLAVALKALHMSRLDEWKSLELFERETRVLRELDHPNIPDYVDDFPLGDDPQVPDGLVLVQELVDGRDLSHGVRAGEAMPEAQVVRWMTQVLDVLVYLHRRDPPVIHRDITPKNIIVKDDGTAYLVDFGAVQAALRSATQVASTAAGTFGYAPMEQFVSAAFPASDLYGLGMSVLAVASGVDPSEMTFSGMRVDIRALELSLDARLSLLLERMTEPDPERRLADAALALEQLRPLLARYAPDRAVSAQALDRVAAQHRAAHAPASRAPIATDDLLPSERIREAHARLEAIGKAGPLGIPRFSASSSPDTVVISADGSLIALEDVLLDGRTFERITRIRYRDESTKICAISTGGEQLLVETYRNGMLILGRDADGSYNERVKLSESGTGPEYAFSPDGRSLARVDGDVLLFDARTGQVVQRIAGYYRWVNYSPDGQWVALAGDGKVRLLAASGGEVSLSGYNLAFSPDGVRAAVAPNDGPVVIGHMTPSGFQHDKSLGRRSSNTIYRMRFSPDGRWLALHDYSDDQLLLLDVERGELAAIRYAARAGEDLSSVKAIGFSPDSQRVLCATDTWFNRFADDDEQTLNVWSLSGGAHLGALAYREEKPPLAVAASGHFGPIPDRGEPDGADKPKSWCRPAAARAALLGDPIDQHLDETARAQLADLETRWAFFVDHAEQIDGEASTTKLVDATSGLTHLLDLVLRQAREAQAAAPTFGGSSAKSDIRLTMDQLISAAKALRARPAGERQVLYEELVAEAVRLEEQQALQQQARQGQAAAADVASRNPYGVAPSTGKPAVAREAAVEPHVLQAQRVDQARKRLFVILMVVLGCVFFGTLAFVLAVI